jgi:hypothetical protein
MFKYLMKDGHRLITYHRLFRICYSEKENLVNDRVGELNFQLPLCKRF